MECKGLVEIWPGLSYYPCLGKDPQGLYSGVVATIAPTFSGRKGGVSVRLCILMACSHESELDVFNNVACSTLGWGGGSVLVPKNNHFCQICQMLTCVDDFCCTFAFEIKT